MTYRTGAPTVATLLLASASLAQERVAFPAPPDGMRSVGVGVMINGRQEVRQLTYSLRSDPEPNDEDVAPPDAQPPARLNINDMVIERENFDRWLFADGRSEEEHRRRLDDALLERAETATRSHRLTEAQRAKLLLAGRGDIKHFFDEVERGRADFEIARMNFRSGHASLTGLDRLTQIYRQGPFGDGSLFAKTLNKIESDRKVGRRRGDGGAGILDPRPGRIPAPSLPYPAILLAEVTPCAASRSSRSWAVSWPAASPSPPSGTPSR